MNKTDKKHYKIFISSPNDVKDERMRAVRVIEKIQTELGERIRLEPIIWEEHYYTADKDFQAQIDRPSLCDMVVCILWSRLGSPLPEQYWKDGKSKTGTEWEFEDAMASAKERHIPHILMYRKDAAMTCPPQNLKTADTDFQCVETFWKQWFCNEQGLSIAASQKFQSTDDFEKQFEAHFREWLSEQTEEVVWSIEQKGSPFRGLEAFDVEHAPVFFGRSRVIRETRARLITSTFRGCGFLLITGMSGSGKSSLLRAGLGLCLTRPGAFPNVDAWRQVTIRPGSGDNPLATLAEAFFETSALPELADGDCPTREEMLQAWREAPSQALRPVGAAISRVTKHIAENDGYDRNVHLRCLVLIDQLEELFAFSKEQQHDFATVIDALARGDRCVVVATLRSDMYTELKTIPQLWTLKDDGGQYTLSPPGPAEIRDIILKPAQAAGLEFEENPDTGEHLAERLERAAGSPGALPLLQFTLDQLFEQRDTEKGLLRFADYDAMGGLEGAIGTHADAIFSNLEEEQHAALPTVILKLVTVRPENPEIVLSRPVSKDAFTTLPEALPLIDAFVAPEARLFVVDGHGESSTVRVAHDALLSHWEKAKTIIEEAKPALQYRARLSQEATAWAIEVQKSEKPRPDLLITSTLFLTEARKLFKQHKLELSSQDQKFLKLSLKRTRRATRLRQFAIAGLIGLTGLTGWMYVRADTQRARAERQKEFALSAVNRLTFDIPEKLSTIPGMLHISRQIFEDNIAMLDRIMAEEPKTPSVTHQRIANIVQTGNMWVTLGNIEKARTAYNSASRTAQNLADSDPGNAQWQRDLSVSYERIGDLLATTGDTDGARQQYEKSQQIFQRLADSDPGNAQGQRDLSVSYNKIGDLLATTGDTDGAKKAYEQDLSITQRLADSDPGNAQWQRDLMVSYYKLSRLDFALHQHDKALALLKKGLAIMEPLVQRDPKNAVWQNDVQVLRREIEALQQE
ncbi:AAA family ATPase [Desulfovibrio inopinatus]|uniref:nSTAND1 domain-containing NTPase n=1 Tax=Desulfovibrio inopinatus TaxID=102109 RepID=UPI0003F6F7B0|nr:AAA family ATPase [Desulfovibrio inopinatus]